MNRSLFFSLLLLISTNTFGQFQNVTGTAQKNNTTGQYRWNFGANGVLNVAKIEDILSFDAGSMYNIKTQYSRSPNIYYSIKTIENTTSNKRDGAKLAVLGNYLFLLGGWHPDISPVTDSQVYRFNQSTTATTKLTDAPWEGRHTFGCITKNDTVYVLGGDLITGNYQKDAWKGVLQPDSTITWSLLNNNLPWGERILFGSTFHNGYIYVIGGQKGSNYSDGVLNDVWRSKDGVSWQKIADGLTQFGKNITSNVVSYSGYIYVIGGGIYDTPTSSGTFENDIWRSKDGIIWEQLPDAPWLGRQYNDCLVYDGKIFTVGGNIGGNIPTDNTNDVWSLDINGYWEQVEVPMTDRHATAVASYNDMLVMSTGNYWNDTWVLKKHNSSIDPKPYSLVARDANKWINNTIFNAESGGSGGYVIGSTSINPNGDASLSYGDARLRIDSKSDIGLYSGSTPTSNPTIFLTDVGQVRLPNLANGMIKLGGVDKTILNAVDGVDYYNPATYPLNLGGETFSSVLARGSEANRSFSINSPTANGISFKRNSTDIGQIDFSANQLNISAANNLLLQPSSGNVGIGNSNPLAKLDINGAIRASSNDGNSNSVVRNIDLGNYVTTSTSQTGLSGNKTWTGDHTFNSAVNFIGKITADKISGSGAGSPLFITDVSGSEYIAQFQTGNVTIYKQLNQNGAAVFNNTVVVPLTPTLNTHAASKGYTDASSREEYLSISSNLTITDASFVNSKNLAIYVDASTTAVNVTLPPVLNTTGKKILVFKTDSSANAVTINGPGALIYINGSSTYTLTSQYASVEIHANSSQYYAK